MEHIAGYSFVLEESYADSFQSGDESRNGHGGGLRLYVMEPLRISSELYT